MFINLICASGMRLSSALNIQVKDIKRKEHAIYVQKTKNRKAQIFYLSDEILTIISKYIRQFDLDEDDYLFCTAEKKPLARRTIQDNVAIHSQRITIKRQRTYTPYVKF